MTFPVWSIVSRLTERYLPTLTGDSLRTGDLGDLSAADRPMRTPVVIEDFDWDGISFLKIPYEEMILYRAHVRGFTKHSTSRTKDKGTFRAMIEKIPYLKELGVTSLELLPVNEFPELMMPEHVMAVLRCG